MYNISKKTFSIDGDLLEVPVIYDEEIKKHIIDYPDFLKCPRITPGGRLWVNVTNEQCPYADTEYGDCGSCRFFRCESPGDLIGVCDNDALIVRKDA